MALTLLPPSPGPEPKVLPGGPNPILRAEGARHVIALFGDLDLSIQRDFCDLLASVVAFGVGDVVIDLGEATSINSAIVRCLANGNQLLVGDDRILTIRSPSTQIARWLLVFGLTALIELEDHAHW